MRRVFRNSLAMACLLVGLNASNSLSVNQADRASGVATGRETFQYARKPAPVEVRDKYTMFLRYKAGGSISNFHSKWRN